MHRTKENHIFLMSKQRNILYLLNKEKSYPDPVWVNALNSGEPHIPDEQAKEYTVSTE